MANRLIIKNFPVEGYTPENGEIEPGELVMNSADRKLFSKHINGDIIEWWGGLLVYTNNDIIQVTQGNYTITNSAPTGVGNTLNGHVWFVY